MRRLLPIALALTLVCSRGDAPPQPPDISGEITEISAIAGGLSLRIEEVPTDSSAGPKAVVRADGTTRWGGIPLITGEIRTGAPTGVHAGMRVQVWFDGPAAMSYPVQARAALIVVLTPR